MKERKFSSNFGKAVFLGWLRSILFCLFAAVVCIMIAIIQRGIQSAGPLFLVIMFVSWPLDIFWRWKSFVLCGNELTVKRPLRPTITIDISENLMSTRYVEHCVYGPALYVVGKIRMVDSQGEITDILCPFMTQGTLDEMMYRINENRISHEGGAIGCL